MGKKTRICLRLTETEWATMNRMAFACGQMDISMDTHMDTSMDTHMDMSMDIHMEMPIKSKVSKLDGLYIQSEPAASRALRRWSNNPSAEGQ